ncbi:Cytochrome c oxidase subunit 5B, mitochondrial [Entomophthora muscae]|uniref:Cytochrome c oxidase subunit 5B, mitochondrial n=1 Tax=Entomophthora muscae TaxID=34485 RepID=A0ACC2RX70_9FUNG|nr:Cytochrome c oxidase subunit 5B, mitochondrial [Entomophthora muscae]
MSRLLTRKLFSSIKPNFSRSLATAQSSQNATVPQHILDSVEVSWAQMTEPQREELREQLAEIQKQDWSKLSIKEKRAAYYVAFGPHGPRAPFPKYTREVFFGTGATLLAAVLLFLAFTLSLALLLIL